MRRQLDMRRRALPTIKSKESALRLEVKGERDAAADYERRLGDLLRRYEYMSALWGEFDAGLLSIAEVAVGTDRIAGVRIPVLEDIVYEQRDYDLFSSPAWFADGIELLKEMSRLGIEYEIHVRRTSLLDYARKKTTQKVNLYEKVQIPGYEEAILKIKRFLEDEENLSKSSQKIVKNKRGEPLGGEAAL